MPYLQVLQGSLTAGQGADALLEILGMGPDPDIERVD